LHLVSVLPNNPTPTNFMHCDTNDVKQDMLFLHFKITSSPSGFIGSFYLLHISSTTPRTAEKLKTEQNNTSIQ